MKKYLCAVAGIIFLCAHGSVSAQQEGILSSAGFEVSGDVTVSSIYMWRGIMLDADPVVQPGIYVRSPESKYGRVKLGLWMSRDMHNEDALKSSETDYIFDYTYNFPSLDVSVGHTYYEFPDIAPADGSTGGFSREVYAGLAFPRVLLSPSLYYYYDYGKKDDGGGEGSYTVINAAYCIPFKLKGYALSFDLVGHIGYNNKQYYGGKGGDAAIGAGINIPLAKNLSCKPTINYSLPWGSLSDKKNGNQKNRFFTGLYLSYSF
ncbi:MAG: hypothetical protein PHG31_00845 [Candidatus Omnitrophica bacterium]|nr:hypothetical protein [Candidatus Omnitrophota bacterium]